MIPATAKIDTQPTHFCDLEHPAIRRQAAALANQAATPEDLARRTFRFVRDQIPFGFDLVQVQASETLAKGYGACFNKSLLLVALLRANGIPARFGSVPVSRWFMQPYLGWLFRLINHPFHHCLVQVWLDGAWSLAEPTLDQATYDALFRPLGVPWGIEWSAARQDRLYGEHLMGEVTIHPDLDQAIGDDVGNSLLPDSLARALCRYVNRRAWGRIGLELSPA
ncbi:MAG: transglutaminase family protein [Deltaproteobacteria bacterium]|nr:transglutaminase family protein [Deltaproteobacteria bacterium]